MSEDLQPAERLADLPKETRDFLSELTREDIATISAGLPIIRMIIGFGKVTKWLAISLFGVLVGFVMLSDSISKILAWFKQP
ncbi:hypothetical protein [Mesorhizobium sp. URHB0026]